MDQTLYGLVTDKVCVHVLVEINEIEEGEDSAGTYVYTIRASKCIRCGYFAIDSVQILENV